MNSHYSISEFYFNHVLPKADEIENLELKCVPGRTVVKIIERPPEPTGQESGDDNDEIAGDMLRSHMNTGMKEEYCKVCVCSVDGIDEYCSQRPAMNVNECLRMTSLVEKFQANEPFDHTRTLAYRIRRDYIWHNDEIPYEPKARCKRGHSYYSNSINANETDIDVASDVESLLDYSNKTVCFYCVCAVHGRSVGCINRLPWFCEYYRTLREESAPRDRYRQLFQQDRPTYFRQLSWRLRRSMDNGMYDFLETVGAPDDKMDNIKCVPFVSEYTDCTDDNSCSGCNKCICVGNDQWSCKQVFDCPGDDVKYVDDGSMDDALDNIQNELEMQQKPDASVSSVQYVPQPSDDKDLLLEFTDDRRSIEERLRMMMRSKRSVEDQTNHTSNGVTFHHTVDELNEDTLKNTNLSGTLQAHKVEPLSGPLKASRRTGLLTDNLSQNSLHIEHNQPKVYDDQLTDNKIDAAVHSDVTSDANIEKIKKTISNHTQKQIDKEVSKLVVNELKSGTEVIGDKNAPITSNITFSPDNDTLTAMAFIAGNLLNKLWNIEKESGEDSRETEALKHEKIADLLDLFKEPLNLRQENFLKGALEQLSEAIDKDKNLNNISLCEKISESAMNIRKNDEENTEKKDIKKEKITGTRKTNENGSPVNEKTISKINNVLSLIHKFQNIQKKLNSLKKTPIVYHSNGKDGSPETKKSHDPRFASDESDSLNVFGTILEKITKLLMPPKKSKKIVKGIRDKNIFKSNDNIAQVLKSMYNMDIDNSNLTVKDKIIFDYLNTVKRNPKCLFSSIRDNPKSVPSIEGDILLNLSEFFKVKSFVDLIKMLEPQAKPNIRASDATTTSPPEVTTETTTLSTTEVITTTQLSNSLQKTKEKLKAHLKTILDDLIELQNMKGQSNNNIGIVDALPCIFKLLNTGNETQSKQHKKDKKVNQSARIAAIFDSLKKELQTTQNRRNNIIPGQRPKSAVVWERIVKNFDGKDKMKTRRSMNVAIPKSYEDIKKQMDQIEDSSRTYKNLALTNGVPASERRILLNTLLEEIKQYINVLNDMKNSLNNLKKLNIDEKIDLKEFVYNAAINIDMDKKIAQNINVFKVNSKNVGSTAKNNQKYTRERYLQKRPLKMLDITKTNGGNNLKLTRDQIINQLIKNRMQMYIKIKEARAADLSNDLNYDIAKKVLVYLDAGNNNLARELYKVLITPKQSSDLTGNRYSVIPNKKPMGLLPKEPVVQFEEPKRTQWLGQDAWLKQLVNLKSMRV